MYCIEFRESTSIKNCQQKLHVTLCNELIIYRKSGILFVFAHDIPKKRREKIVITCFFLVEERGSNPITTWIQILYHPRNANFNPIPLARSLAQTQLQKCEE